MSGRSWKFESSHGHEKQKSVNSRFFLLYHYPFRVLFSTYYTKLSLVVVKKTRQHRQQRQHFYFQKVLSKVVQSCRQNNHYNINNKDNISFLFQKVLSKVVPRCRQKNTTKQTTKTTFLSYSQKLLSKVVPRCRQKKSSFHENIYLCLRKY